MNKRNYKIKHLLVFNEDTNEGFDLDYKEYEDGTKVPICCEKIKRSDVYGKV